MIRTLLLTVLISLTACTTYRDLGVPMATQAIEPERYAGLWYEIARYPVFFQRGCTATTAEYGVIDATTLSVVNTCHESTPDGPVKGIEGTAEVVGPGQLSVRLGRVPFAAPYWVLWVDADYDTAVVGVPSGRAGWILAREPAITPEKMAEARGILRDNGYDPVRLILTEQARP